MSDSDSGTLLQRMGAWANLLKLGFGITLAAMVFWLNTTYVKRVDFVPVAQSIRVQSEQMNSTSLEVKSISRRLSKIVDDEGNPVNTDLMVEIREDIARILSRQELIEKHLGKQNP